MENIKKNYQTSNTYKIHVKLRSKVMIKQLSFCHQGITTHQRSGNISRRSQRVKGYYATTVFFVGSIVQITMTSDMKWNADRTINLHFAESIRPPAIIQQQQINYMRLTKWSTR